MKYNIALVVGRFQPYHNMHHKLVQHALSLGNEVLILLGSAKSAPDVKNPFTPEMREKMIRSCFDEQTNKRLHFVGIRDYPYHENIWITEVQNAVRNLQEESIELSLEQDALHNIKLSEQKVCLVGHFKDETSYYLKLFPQWTYESFYENTKESSIINATDIRSAYLLAGQVTPVPKGEKWELIRKLVPESVAEFMFEFLKTETYDNLVKEYNYIQRYKEDTKFKGVPFPATFVTTDTVVTAKGHVLVIRRGANPGKGLLALPGGFLEPNLTLKDNALKELKEETRIHVPDIILESSIIGDKIFDYPNRSLRGRTITHAFHVELKPKMNEGLPLVKGGDDAVKAFWLPIASIGENEDKFFEDHVHIIRYFLGVL